MALARTRSITETDAVTRDVIGGIHSRFWKGGLKCVDESVVHSPDGPDTAKAGIAFFFAGTGTCPRTR